MTTLGLDYVQACPVFALLYTDCIVSDQSFMVETIKAWDLWNTERCADLVDKTTAGHSCSFRDVMLCIQVGLLCVQERAEDRPSMSDVVSMLGSEGVNLPPPKQPAFSTLLSVPNGSESRRQRLSQNLVTMSAIEAR